MLIDGFESIYNNNSATKKFSDVFEDLDSFKSEFRSSPLNEANLTDATLGIVYAELYARYGDSYYTATNMYRNKLKTFSILKNEGLIFQKKLEIQNAILNMSLADLKDDGVIINNYAENPGDEATDTIVDVGEYTGEDFMKFVNNQSAQKSKKGKLTAYRDQLYSLKNVTDSFIDKFKVLFEKLLWSSYLPIMFREEEIEEESEGEDND